MEDVSDVLSTKSSVFFGRLICAANLLTLKDVLITPIQLVDEPLEVQ